MKRKNVVVTYPGIRGQLLVGIDSDECEEFRIYLAGDPAGLRSFAVLLHALADVDQKSLPSLPERGAHEHLHLRREEWFTPGSVAEVCVSRLDDKHGDLNDAVTLRDVPPSDDIRCSW